MPQQFRDLLYGAIFVAAVVTPIVSPRATDSRNSDAVTLTVRSDDESRPAATATPSQGDWRQLREEFRPAGPRDAAASALLVPPVDLRVTNNASAQNETSIAADPNNPLRVIGGFNDYSLLATGFGGNGVAYSSNGGNTFTHHPTGVPLPAGFTNAGGDPSIAFDSRGRAFYAHIASAAGGTFTGNNGVFVARSLDGGASWAPTVAVVSHVWPGAGTVDFEDKEMIAADHNVTSLFRDRLYISWTRFYAGNYPGSATAGGGDIMLSHSDDAGATWSAPIRLTDPVHQPANGGTGTAGTSFVQGSEPAVGPDGSVYVVYYFGGRVEVVRSVNGGATFGPPTQPFGAAHTSAGLVDHDAAIGGLQLPNMAMRVNAFPNIEVDPTNASRIFVVAVDDPTNDATGDGANIIFARSTDFAATWNAPITLNDDATTRNQFFPWMAVSALGTIEVIWYDTRLSPGNNTLDVYATASGNGGASFVPNVRLTDITFQPNTGQFPNNSFFGDYNGLGTAGAAFHALWTDGRVGEQEIYYDRPAIGPNVSTDVVFLLDVTGSTGALLPQWQAQIPNVVAAWQAFDPNVRFALASHVDFPFEPYGDPVPTPVYEWAYRRETSFSSNTGPLFAALAALTNEWGNDDPESQYEAIYQVLTGSGRDLNANGFFTDLGDIPPQPLGQLNPLVIYHFTWPEMFHDRDVEPNYPYPGSAPVAGKTLTEAEIVSQAGATMFFGLTFVSSLGAHERWMDNQLNPFAAAFDAAGSNPGPLAELAALTNGAVYEVGGSLELLQAAVDSSIAHWASSEQFSGDADGDGIANAFDNCIFVSNPGQEDQNANGIGDACECPITLTGDVNLSGSLTSADIIGLVNFVFKSAAPPQPCQAAGDVNCDGRVTSADIIAMVNYVFKSAAPPCDVCSLIPASWSCP